MQGPSASLSGQIRCPVCEQWFDPQQSTAMPFCSVRCRQIDLGRWLRESYRLPIERPEDAEEGQDFPNPDEQV